MTPFVSASEHAVIKYIQVAFIKNKKRIRTNFASFAKDPLICLFLNSKTEKIHLRTLALS